MVDGLLGLEGDEAGRINADMGGVNRETTQEPGQDRAWYGEGEGDGKEEEVKGQTVVTVLYGDGRASVWYGMTCIYLKGRCVCIQWRIGNTPDFQDCPFSLTPWSSSWVHCYEVCTVMKPPSMWRMGRKLSHVC